ncbi:MAG: hypothetical protein GY861_07340 [bacterium]|nr:hypothetical protein [bacterium]
MKVQRQITPPGLKDLRDLLVSGERKSVFKGKDGKSLAEASKDFEKHDVITLRRVDYGFDDVVHIGEGKYAMLVSTEDGARLEKIADSPEELHLESVTEWEHSGKFDPEKKRIQKLD